ncbi:hypothetical protein ACTID9_08490 [Brevibacillus fluminis]|uniref:hypothetical protein n=1 Tax=Brevibacillus fluminis TaxID=511487 RepID=UPI003F8C003D
MTALNKFSTGQKRQTNKWMSTALASAILLSSLGTGTSAFAQTTVAPTAAAAVTPAAVENYAAYLKENYDIQFSASLTKASYIDALAKALKIEKTALSSDTKADSALTAADAVSLAVRAAGLKELAYSYPQEKVAKSLAKANVNGQALAPAAAQEIAAAIDTNLVPASYYGLLADKKPATAELASTLIGKALSFTGAYKHYLGYVSDSDIYGKVYQAWTASSLIDAPELRKVVDQAVKQSLVTGYNLKDSRFNANFDPARSLTYGHSDITHAIQLIGLLKSEGLDAKVQFEPKTSAFLYLKEWGEPTQTPDYKVVQIENGNYIAYSKEYDLSFEFATAADKEAFDAVINKFAKKNEENPKGLIYASWWQPLYYSANELKGYQKITNNYIAKDHYIAQSFSLNDKAADVAAGFKKIDPSVSVTSYQFWVDQPFFNYLNGESK